MCLSITQNRDVDWVSAGTYNIIWLKKMLLSKAGFYCRTSENHDSGKGVALKPNLLMTENFNYVIFTWDVHTSQ